MPGRRGTLVGDAYIRIHADSSVMDRELRRQARFIAQTRGTEFEKDWNRVINERAQARRGAIENKLIDGIVGGRPEWERQFKQSGLAIDDFRRVVRAKILQLNRDMQGTLRAPRLEGLHDILHDLDSFASHIRSVQQIEAETRAQKEQVRVQQQAARALLVIRRQQDRDERRRQQLLARALAPQVDPEFAHSLANKLQQALDRESAKTRDRLIKGIIGGKDEWERQFKKSGLASVEEFIAKTKREISQVHISEGFFKDRDIHVIEEADLSIRQFEKSHRSLSRFISRDDALKRFAERAGFFGRSMVEVNRHLDRGHGSLVRFSNVLGRVFGKGSRNNFFNFVGTVVQGIGRIAGAIAHVSFRALTFGLQTVLTLGDLVGDVFKGIFAIFRGEGLGKLGSAFADFGKNVGDIVVVIGTTLLSAVANIIPLLLALAAAFVVVQFALFPLIALVANLAGALFALASEVLVAIVGILGAIAPLAAIAGAAIILLIQDITNLKKATDKQKAAMKPWQKAWDKFMNTLKGPVLDSFIRGLNSLAPLLKPLTDFLKPLSKGLENFMKGFGKALQDPAFKKFLNAFGKVIPGLGTTLGKAFGDAVVGIGIFLQAMLPFAADLAKAIGEAAKAFADFMKDPKKRKDLVDFFKNAWDAGKKLWSIITEIIGIFGALIGIATDNKPGQSILDSILAQLEEWRAWIDTHQQTIQDFFTNARDTAAQLGTSIGDIATALGGVDWQKASEDAQVFIDVVGQIITDFTIFFSGVPQQFALLEILWLHAGSFFVTVYNNSFGLVFKAITAGIIAAITQMSVLISVGASIPGPFGAAFRAVQGVIQQAIIKVAQLGNALGTLPDPVVTITVKTVVDTVTQAILGIKRAAAILHAGRFGGPKIGAAGGMFNQPTNMIIGEAGREALVPLDRPIHLVDKSVRELAVMARLMMGPTKVSGPTSGPATASAPARGGVVFHQGAVVVNAPNSDPVLVAESVLDRFALHYR